MSVERDPMRQRILIVLACFGAVVLLTNLALVTATDFGLRIEKLQLPVVLGGKPKGESLGLGENVGYGGFIYLFWICSNTWRSRQSHAGPYGILTPPGPRWALIHSLDLGDMGLGN